VSREKGEKRKLLQVGADFAQFEEFRFRETVEYEENYLPWQLEQ
jgi:hypothetical protein